MSKNKTPIQQLVEEWLSLDKKRDLRDATYSWLRLPRKVKTSMPETGKETACPDKQGVPTRT
jgi:hypothetical protein